MTNYTYPNISFNSKIIGPTPATPPWRDGYAIVGEFNRGPNVPITSNQLSVLTALYGEDKSSGSIALQQAMLQGASNATVVRVVPGTEPARMQFEIAGDNQHIVPRTGYETTVSNTSVLDSFNRTTGFKLNFNYIGDALLTNTHYGNIRTAFSVVEHEGFSGRGQMNFEVVATKNGNGAEPVVYEDDDETISLSLYNSSYSDYQIATYLEGNNAYVEQYLEPGFSLRVDGKSQTFGLTIVSAPFTINESTGLKGVLLKGHYSPASTISGTLTSVNTTREIEVESAKLGAADFEPTAGQLTIMEDGVAIFNEQAFPIDSIAEDTGVITVNFTKSISSAANEDTSVTFAPVVQAMAFASGVTNVTVKGLPSDLITVGSKVTFGSNLETAYEVTAILTPYAALTGIVVISLAGDVRSGIKVADYVLITSSSSTVITEAMKVHFSAKSKVIVGYTFQPLDSGSSLTAADEGRRYLNLPGTSFDSFVALSEGQGGKNIKFHHHTGPNTLSAATRLYKEAIGFSHFFGFNNDSRTYLNLGTRWSVPFAKDYVEVGGMPGSGNEYPVGTQANIIMKDLELAIYASPVLSSMLSDVKTDFTKVPYKFTGVTSFTGLEGNRCHWTLERYIVGPTAVYESNTGLVIDVVDTPDILDPTKGYSLLFNGKLYPVADVDFIANTVTVTSDDGSDFLDLLSPDDVIQFVSQQQTRDLMMRVNEDEFFSTSNYGTSNLYNFFGGRDSARFSYRDFYTLNGSPLVRVQAVSPGLYGNNIKVTILPDEITKDGAKFYLQIEDTDQSVAIGASKVETFYLDTTAIDLNTGVFLDTRESNLVRAFFIPALEAQNRVGTERTIPTSAYRSLPLRVAPPLELQDASYGSGYTRINAQGAATVKDISLIRGAEFVDTDPPSALRARISGYLSALKQIETTDITWIGVVGINYDNKDYKEVFDYLKQICDNSLPSSGGFRRGVVQLSAASSPRQAASLKAQANSSRFIQIAGTAQGFTTNGILYQQASVVGSYIGLGASRPPHISPASVYGNRTPVGLTYSSIMSTPAILEAYTQANAEVFHFDACMNSYKFLNGVTTNNSPGLRYVSVVHCWDQVRDAIYKALLPYRSQPATPQLWVRIATACDALLANFMREEWLLRYASTICDERNNSEADLIAGVINILIRATPTFPADYIRVTDILDMRATLTLNAQPGQSISDF